MATAALRGILVVSAVVLGVFLLSRAFPTEGVVAPPPVETPLAQPDEEPTSPAPPDEEEGEDGGNQEECPEPNSVRVQVLNGTDVTGLATETADELRGLGYRMPLDPSDATQEYDTTVIFAKRRAQAAAECLRQEMFPTAQIDEGAPDEVDVTVILGADFAEARQD